MWFFLTLAALGLLAYLAMTGRAARTREAARRNADLARKTVPTSPYTEAEDLVACPLCGMFVPQGRAQACGREGCPF
jgi:hypothetical protein